MTAQKTPGRIVRLVARALRERDRGNQHYNKSGEAPEKARLAGLKVDQQVEVTLLDSNGAPYVATFTLADNFQGDAAFRATRIPHFELKKVSKKALKEAEGEAA